MITPNNLDFPNNVVIALAVSYATIGGVEIVCKRALRPTDGNVAIGVFPVMWSPQEYEIGPNAGPAVSRYTFQIQAFVKHGDEEVGLAAHATLTKLIKAMLYRDQATRASLNTLSVETAGISTERTQRYEVGSQRFLSNEVSGTFLYFSTTDFWLETETV